MPVHTLPLSVVVIALNEERRIGGCIDSVLALTDDIVVVDALSRDATASLARARGARVFERPWAGFSAQKNFGNEQARYDWILSLDADERVSPALADALRAEFARGPACDVYDLRFENYFGARRVRFGAWNPESHARLFDRRRFVWNSDDVHEGLCGPADCRRGKLGGTVVHFTVESHTQLAAKTERYAGLFAANVRRAGRTVGWPKIWLNPGWRFVRDYLIRLGVLDGWAGFVIAFEAARYTHLKYAGAQTIAARRAARATLVWTAAAAAAVLVVTRVGSDGVVPAGTSPAYAVQELDSSVAPAPGAVSPEEVDDDNNASLDTLADDDDMLV